MAKAFSALGAVDKAVSPIIQKLKFKGLSTGQKIALGSTAGAAGLSLGAAGFGLGRATSGNTTINKIGADMNLSDKAIEMVLAKWANGSETEKTSNDQIAEAAFNDELEKLAARFRIGKFLEELPGAVTKFTKKHWRKLGKEVGTQAEAVGKTVRKHYRRAERNVIQPAMEETQKMIRKGKRETKKFVEPYGLASKKLPLAQRIALGSAAGATGLGLGAGGFAIGRSTKKD